MIRFLFGISRYSNHLIIKEHSDDSCIAVLKSDNYIFTEVCQKQKIGLKIVIIYSILMKKI